MSTEITDHAALRLKRLRKTSGLTQADMAERMGFKTASGYARWENPDLAQKEFLPADKIAQLLDILTPRGVSETAIRELGFSEAGPIRSRPLTEAVSDPHDRTTLVDMARMRDAIGVVHEILSHSPDSVDGQDLATLSFAVYDEATRAGEAQANKARKLELKQVATDIIRIAKMLKG